MNKLARQYWCRSCRKSTELYEPEHQGSICKPCHMAANALTKYWIKLDREKLKEALNVGTR